MITNKLLSSNPHRRYNPLKEEWVLVSPQRTTRPWQGHKEAIINSDNPIYDPNCYLCPGNIRANNDKNPDYEETFVFQNDFPALKESKLNNGTKKTSELTKIENVKGTCRVVCFSPKHNLTLANMTEFQIQRVIETWINQINELKKQFKWIQIFENKGAMMGCSNSHPHGQIWASNFIPNEIEKENSTQQKYFIKNKSVMLIDYANLEIKQKERIVTENSNWIVVVPFWATWPFETLLLPKKHSPFFDNLNTIEKDDLSIIMKKLLIVYDKLFLVSMPYSMGWHFAPFNKKDNNHWQLHAHYYPPLLRSSSIKKFMVGYEMLAEAQRDITPEQAASKLKSLI
jgi:UDPglucose--hexose-1-phosphate uridylyltransferase